MGRSLSASRRSRIIKTIQMKPVKTTRTIKVAGIVLTSADLRRIAKLFQKQSGLAEKSGHRASTEYQVKFDDDTELESDSPEPSLMNCWLLRRARCR